MADPLNRRVRIEPAVPESWLARVLHAGVSPSEFAEFALAQIDLDGALRAYKSHQAGGVIPHRVVMDGTTGEVEGTETTGAWSPPVFSDYLDSLARSREFRHPLALLAAYLRLGEAPTGEQLQEACGFPRGSAPWEQVWHQELRAAKARLTIQARRKSLPAFFLTPSSTASKERVHPIDPEIFTWLTAWARRNPGSLPDPSQWGPQIEASPKYAGSLLRRL